MLFRRADEPKAERLLGFPPPLPPFTTRAFPPRTTLAGIFASDLVIFRTEWRVDRAFTLFATVALESCAVGGWMDRGSPIGVGSAAPDVS